LCTRFFDFFNFVSDFFWRCTRFFRVLYTSGVETKLWEVCIEDNFSFHSLDPYMSHGLATSPHHASKSTFFADDFPSKRKSSSQHGYCATPGCLCSSSARFHTDPYTSYKSSYKTREPRYNNTPYSEVKPLKTPLREETINNTNRYSPPSKRIKENIET